LTLPINLHCKYRGNFGDERLLQALGLFLGRF
jgi:hypothetical protein